MAKKVLTAPLAIITANNVPVGKMRNVRITETLRRGRVAGIGELLPQELPALEWNGTLNCQAFFISLQAADNNGITGAITRDVKSVKEFVDTILLNENGLDVRIYRKTAKTIDPSTGVVTVEGTELIGSVKGCFADREGFDISEGQISGKDQDFTYMQPILFII